MPWVNAAGGDTLLTVWVVPGASRDEVVGPYGDALRLRVKAPPERGRANRAAAELLARRLGAEVRLERGGSSRRKVFRVVGLTPAQVVTKLSDAW